MVAKRKRNLNDVFLVHKFETATGRHRVHFGKNFNRKGSSKEFRKIDNAVIFAAKKTKALGLRKFLADTPKGVRKISAKKILDRLKKEEMKRLRKKKR